MNTEEPVVVHEADVERKTWDDPTRGRLSFRTLFSAGTTPTNSLTTGIAELAPGDQLGLHQHAPAEIYYVLEGRGVVFLDDAAHEVGTGSSIFVPGDTDHGARNTGTTPLRIFYAFAVDSFDDVEYRFP